MEEEIVEQFTSRFVEKVEAIRIGNPMDEQTEMGTVISPEHLLKIESYIDLAEKEGGVILTGGTRKMTGFSGPDGIGAFLRPTVVGNLSHTSRCATEEIFGPMVTLHTFSSEQEALHMVNASEYGLAGSVWTSDLERGQRFQPKSIPGLYG